MLEHNITLQSNKSGSMKQFQCTTRAPQPNRTSTCEVLVAHHEEELREVERAQNIPQIWQPHGGSASSASAPPFRMKKGGSGVMLHRPSATGFNLVNTFPAPGISEPCEVMSTPSVALSQTRKPHLSAVTATRMEVHRLLQTFGAARNTSCNSSMKLSNSGLIPRFCRSLRVSCCNMPISGCDVGSHSRDSAIH